jgi:hypothetical protein
MKPVEPGDVDVLARRVSGWRAVPLAVAVLIVFLTTLGVELAIFGASPHALLWSVTTFISVYVVHELLHVIVMRYLGFPAKVKFSRRHRTFSVTHPGAVLTRRAALTYTAAPMVALTVAGSAILLVGHPATTGVGVTILIANTLGSSTDIKLWCDLRAKAHTNDEVIDTEYGFRITRAPSSTPNSSEQTVS